MSTHHHEHTHDHVHDHDHGHDHDHDHDGDTYFLDQICMVGISGAFGAICLALYISNWMAPNDQTMLRRLLGPQFHLFILGSGVALVLVALIRGLTLWRQAGTPAHTHDHTHEHDHEHGECGHDHGICDLEHGHHHHHHDAGQAHHHHDHDAADHDHGWAPWRYVLLLVPIILFLLGLPNKGPGAKDTRVELDMTTILAGYGGMVASAPTSEGQLLTWVAAMYMTEETPIEIGFKDLENLANSPALRSEWRGRTVRVRGQFAPNPGSDQVFSLQRFRISCCAADAIAMNVPIVTREPLTKRSDLSRSDWIKVTGIVDFHRVGNAEKTVMRVMSLDKIEKCAPDNNPYLQ